MSTLRIGLILFASMSSLVAADDPLIRNRRITEMKADRFLTD